MALHLAPFDPDREFVTAAAFRANGTLWGRGYHFDKSTVDLRVLKLLFQTHKLIYDDDPRAIALLTRNGGAGKAPRRADKPRELGKPTGANGENRKSEPSQIPATEEDKIKRLMARHGKADLLALASKIPGVKPTMNKTAIATALVRSGHGNS